MQELEIRPATLRDIGELEQLQRASALSLSLGYSSAQLAAFLEDHGTIDRQLVEDGTYFVATDDVKIVGCGGWSFRNRLFGGSVEEATHSRREGPARMRAFFVHPDFARRGIARGVLAVSERAAFGRGYRRALLQATVAGRPLYASQGYRVCAEEWIEVDGAPPLPTYRMEKALTIEDGEEAPLRKRALRIESDRLDMAGSARRRN